MGRAAGAVGVIRDDQPDVIIQDAHDDLADLFPVEQKVHGDISPFVLEFQFPADPCFRHDIFRNSSFLVLFQLLIINTQHDLTLAGTKIDRVAGLFIYKGGFIYVAVSPELTNNILSVQKIPHILDGKEVCAQVIHGQVESCEPSNIFHLL